MAIEKDEYLKFSEHYS